MNRVLGVLLMVVVLYAVLMALDENARSASNQKVIAARLARYGVISVGVGVLIVAGGIDLSIGSVLGLGAVCFALLLEKGIPPLPAALAVLAGSLLLGLIHGLLVTGLGLQAFLVTLCGLFIYRGLARYLAPQSVGLTVSGATDSFQANVNDFRDLMIGTPGGIPRHVFILLAAAVVLGLLLHGTRYGRYLFAIGANEDAARYAGVATGRYKVLAYVICSGMAGLGSLLLILEDRTATPASAGQMMELYAITGAVLGGCSLRGGEGTVIGMVLGAAVLPLLSQLCQYANISSELEFPVIGAALLLGTIADEVLKRRAARKR
jgi:ribose transport system permease protein